MSGGSIEAALAHYPSPDEVDRWAEDLRARAAATSFEAQVLADPVFRPELGMRHTRGVAYVAFTGDGGHRFHAVWQPVRGGPAPLLVHLPGYGHEISIHPELVAMGYNVLHVSPLGYATPGGLDEQRMREGIWPVMPDTVESGGERGYVDWFCDCLVAIEWARARAEVEGDRVSLFGTSQGGGAALILASLLQGDGVRCAAADEPFLTHFPLGQRRGAYKMADTLLGDPPRAWRAVGFVDTIAHVHRLTVPVLLTAGELDATCPPETIAALFERLPATRSLTRLAGEGHGYTAEFLHLAAAWFRLYA